MAVRPSVRGRGSEVAAARAGPLGCHRGKAQRRVAQNSAAPAPRGMFSHRTLIATLRGRRGKNLYAHFTAEQMEAQSSSEASPSSSRQCLLAPAWTLSPGPRPRPETTGKDSAGVHVRVTGEGADRER